MVKIPPRIEHLGSELVYRHHTLTDKQIQNRMEKQAAKERTHTSGMMYDGQFLVNKDGVANDNVLRAKNRISDVSISTYRTGRWKHRIEVISPPIFGFRFKWTETVDQEKVDDRLGHITKVINKSKVQILEAWLGGLGAVKLRSDHNSMQFPNFSTDGARFQFDESELFDAWNYLESKREEHIDDILRSIKIMGGATEFRGIYGYFELWLVHLAMHEIYMEIKNAIEEGTDMGKGGEEMVWWAIEGDATKLKGLTVSLTRSRNYVVYDTPRRLYLKIQNSEKQFVREHTADHNLTAKRVHHEPEHEQAPCEKYVTDLALHTEGGGGRGQKKCRSCQTLLQNAHKATISDSTNQVVEELSMSNGKKRSLRPNGTAPALVPANGKAQEEKEWAAQNGDVIVVQGPTPGIDPLDFEALAQDNRRVANDLLARASWYEATADKYESLLRPSDAVRQAEEALKKAQEDAVAERKSQIETLQKMLEDGPPLSSD